MSASAKPDEDEDVSILAEAKESQAYGAGIMPEAAVSVARAAARLAALAKGATLLDTDLAARFGVKYPSESQDSLVASGEERMLVLASIVFPLVFHDQENESKNGEVTVTARILLSPQNPAQVVRRTLNQPDNLELRLLALRQIKSTLAEAKEIFARNLANPQSSENPFLARIDFLSKRLNALDAFLNALRKFDSTWIFPNEAATLMDRLCRLDTHNSLLWTEYGEALLLLERPYEALDALQTACRLQEVPARAVYLRGIAHLRLHLPSNAVNDFSEALTLHPEKAAWWRARGAALLLADEHEAMCSDFYHACSLGDCEGLESVRKRGFCLEAN